MPWLHVKLNYFKIISHATTALRKVSHTEK